MLFSEPKIPQFQSAKPRLRAVSVSVLFSEPKIPQLKINHSQKRAVTKVSVLFSEPKIPQSVDVDRVNVIDARVSVLFSEPKIPQSNLPYHSGEGGGVSVLFSEPKIPQSMRVTLSRAGTAVFQCSSASRKFLNGRRCARHRTRQRSFSALQRAENSSMLRALGRDVPFICFSALQRAENSSI